MSEKYYCLKNSQNLYLSKNFTFGSSQEAAEFCSPQEVLLSLQKHAKNITIKDLFPEQSSYLQIVEVELFDYKDVRQRSMSFFVRADFEKLFNGAEVA